MKDFCYPVSQGKFGNPLASSYLRPITQHIDDLCKSYPSLSAWLQTARVTFLDRAISFSVPAGQTVVQTFNLSGGYDCLVFERNITAVNTTPPVAGFPFNRLPNERASYVELQIARKDGLVDTEQCAIQNNFGFGWKANKRPPEFWSGADLREFTLVNNSVNDVTVTITFTLVLL